MDNKREMAQERPISPDERENMSGLLDDLCHFLLEQEFLLRENPEDKELDEFVNKLKEYIRNANNRETFFLILPKWLEQKMASFDRELYVLIFDPEIRARYPVLFPEYLAKYPHMFPK